MELDIIDIPVESVGDQLQRSFEQIANQKDLDFIIAVEPGVPQTIRTDVGRLQQVLKNLLSNAFKFTDQGRVELQVRLADDSIELNGVSGNRYNRTIAFAVSDTGIGIAPDKQRLIFEAFQQADGTTSRRYGGTGLGLSISREIARLLGGRIHVESELGKGSTFTLYIPETHEESDELPSDEFLNDELQNDENSDLEYSDASDGLSDNSDETSNARDGAQSSSSGEGSKGSNTGLTARVLSANAQSTAETRKTSARKTQPDVAFDPATAENPLNDDRDSITESDRVLLIIEDDVNFARILIDTVRQKGFKAIVALTGDVGLAMTRHYLPDAITLDLQLPVLDGWTVLDQIKRDPTTRHIPVEVISVADRNQGSVVSAISYLQKPVSSEALEGAFSHISDFIGRDVRRLLLVEDDEAQRNSIIELIGNRDVVTTAVGTGKEALATLQTESFDCVILDLGLPDMEGFEVLKKMKRQAKFRDLPVVIYTSKDLSKREETQLKKYAATILNKDVQSPDRLLDETALFLHRVVSKLPEAKQRVLEEQREISARSGRSTRPQNAASVKGRSTSVEATPPFAADTSALAGKKVLVVDDDVRNVFALTSVLEEQREISARSNRSTRPQNAASGKGRSTPTEAAPPFAADTSALAGKKVLVVDDDVRNVFALTSVLETYGLDVTYADNGRTCLEMLKVSPDVDIVLMDVMMPEMDGYETMRTIRQMENFQSLPIIALTAKAMQGDREKCLEAGASDYIPKPVDTDRLLAIMSSWVTPPKDA
jgi:CheY-like chemotaxis protein